MVERDGGISGYTTGLNYFGHSVAESNRDLQALIGAAENLVGRLDSWSSRATPPCSAGAWSTACAWSSPTR